MSERVTATNPEGDFEIFVMKADGSHQRQITFNALDDESPAWSPDGRRIAFARDFDPIRGEVDFDLFTMNADGTDQRNLTSSPGVLDQAAELVAGRQEDRLRERRATARLRGLHGEAQRLERPAAHVQRRGRVPSELVTGRQADHLHQPTGTATSRSTSWTPTAATRRT